MARLLIKSDGSNGIATLDLKQGVNRIGRNSSNDLVLAETGISDFHCEVLVDGELVFVRDLDSTNGTFIGEDQIRESAIYAGEVLRVGKIEMQLDAPQISLAIPELPKPDAPQPVESTIMEDGYAACLSHASRHAVWECPECQRQWCDECIRRLRRVGGNFLKLCPSCSNQCHLTAWSEMMRNKRNGFFGSLVSKLTQGIKRTTRLISR